MRKPLMLCDVVNRQTALECSSPNGTRLLHSSKDLLGVKYTRVEAKRAAHSPRCMVLIVHIGDFTFDIRGRPMSSINSRVAKAQDAQSTHNRPRMFRWVLWASLRFLIALFLIRVLTFGPPTDAVMIRRFESNLWALSDTSGKDFVSSEARESWFKELRIDGAGPGGSPRIIKLQVYSDTIPFRIGGSSFKGYAFIPAGVAPDGRIVSRLDGGAPPGFTYRHLDGNWYLYVLKSD